MNYLIDVLSREHSKARCRQIERYVGTNPKRFAALVNVFLAGPYRITQRAAWPIGGCVKRHPLLIRPHLRRIIRNLDQPGLHDSVRRNTIRLLQFVRIPAAHQGQLAETCFRLLRDARQPVAVRVFSMTVLANLCEEQPDLKQELKILVEDQYPFGTAGLQARSRRVLKQLG